MSRVLLAEDDEAIAEPLARALRREGHEVSVHGDGQTAFEAVRAGTADMLVLDLGLPGMDGLEVCRALRAGGHTLPVLVLTARNDEVGTVVPRERIMREVWQADWWGSSKTLDMHVSWLRRKLGDDAAFPR